ncbi:carboxypeptidase regulatory-like domain-containing protein [Phycicoccus sp. M110.8]|uniref:carboxypeptidase regulatory-like domain-containing protein n=1 Tax=Phycicoccus sp. M110.8 TaxID=3075433 RepID=UPI0028FD4823|nr:carboxypeptidase regulatory-like domain-containing protein [Phycicoccus sp. M110.8]MDU0315061.1 carboxypeptidase regulatory-like domain-containing protein [Phycicoccus sp. M110.8]
MRARLSRVGGIVAAAVLATGVLAAPAHAEPSQLDGTITSAATGDPVAGCANVYDLAYTWVGGGCSDDTGHWVVDGVESGTAYKVEVYGQDSVYATQWSGGGASFDEATPVTAPATVDTALAYSREVGDAQIGGTITADDTGNPLPGCVTVYTEALDFVGSTCAGDDGTWSVGQLVAGAGYKVEVSAYDDQHVGEWAQDAASFEDAQAVTAPATVDVGLALGGHLQGTLTRVDGQPAQWAQVDVSTTGENARTEAFAQTDDSGHWSALVRPGEYTVQFTDWPASQWAFGQTTPDAADHFTVAAGDTVQVDDQFLPAAKVQGTVRSDATGQPVGGACVTVYAPGSDVDNLQWAGEGCVDDTGAYSVDVSQPGDYIAEFTDPQGRYVSEFSGDTRVVGQAAEFSVARGTPATVDASLATGATLTGLAVDAKTGAVLSDVCPNAYLGRTGGWVRGSVSGCSGADGRWTVRGLPAGSVTLAVQQVTQESAYSLTWAFKATSQATADLITVKAGATTSVRNVQMMPGGTVSGTITGPDGQPVADAWVNVGAGFPGRAGPGEGRWSAKTGSDGRYTVHGVPPGTYTAFVYTENYSGDLAPEWSGDATTAATAQSFKVKALKDVRFDAQLAPASKISGTVLQPDGSPVDRYLVGMVFAADGSYIGDFDVYGGPDFTTSALPAGSFTLQLMDPETGQSWWYDGATDRAHATAVPLGVGEQAQVTVHLP